MEYKIISPPVDPSSNIQTQNKIESTSVENMDKIQPFLFQKSFEGYMDMYSDGQTVAEYLDFHEHWFNQCAKPMKVSPFGNNGYIMTVGQFKSFGYEVEPKIAVILNPAKDWLYTMYTVDIPNYDPPGYQVNYQAEMELQETTIDRILDKQVSKVFRNCTVIPSIATRVNWKLDLTVEVEFPNFIRKLPDSLIQNTGDSFLVQIVRQISPRLTYKVQQDFHCKLDLPIPPRSGRKFALIPQNNECVA